MTLPVPVVRVALIIGGIVDLSVALLSLFFQPLIGPLLDFPVKDPALTTIAGGEFLIVALLYGLLLRDPARFRPLFWLVALDQFFAAALVALEIGRGNAPASWKTIGPIPLNLLLAVAFVACARARANATTREP